MSFYLKKKLSGCKRVLKLPSLVIYVKIYLCFGPVTSFYGSVFSLK